MNKMTSRTARLIGASALALLVLPGPVRAASGTDLAFGYTWRDALDGATVDNVAFEFGMDGRWEPLDDEPPLNVPLPFPFTFYGTTYNAIWLSDNGWISFGDPVGDPHPIPGPIPDAATGPPAMLAPLWTDQLASGSASRFIRYGPGAVGTNAFRVQMALWDESAVQALNVDVLLFLDGRIEFRYRVDLSILDATVGIENGAGDDGIEIASDGTVAEGFEIFNNQVVEFWPPSALADACGALPELACGTTNGSTPGASARGLDWYCNDATMAWDAQEALYRLTLTEATELDIALTGTAQQAFLLDECNERRCLRGPGQTFSAFLGPGEYAVAIDGAAADEGAFTLDLTCTPAGTPLGCDAMAVGDTTGGPSRWASYPCAPARDLSGPEQVFALDVPMRTNLNVSLGALAADLDVLLLAPGQGEVSSDDCILWGDDGFIAWDLPAGSYLLVVDGVAGAAGSFDVTTSCAVGLDCSTPEGTIDMTGSRVVPFMGDTTGDGNDVATYSCDPAVVNDGEDEVWEVVLDRPGQLFARQTDGAPGLRFHLLEGCNEGSCTGTVNDGIGCVAMLEAGTHWLVVDSVAPDGGPYEAELIFEEQFNRWSECADPEGATTLEDTASTFWNFNDAAFCTHVCTDQTSCDPDGAPCSDGSDCLPNPNSTTVGCTFAMYVVVPCGTEFHLPFYDTEGGHVRVFDVFQGEYVFLTALSGGGWFLEGTDIEWQDADCAAGSDPRWNETITDVSFERPDGICGVFRLEFEEHSGNVWELYANCSGGQSGQFLIFDNACEAMAAYEPLPNVTLEMVSATTNCPDIEVTYTLRNDGCTEVVDFPVSLVDGLEIVDTDVVPLLPAGETVTRTLATTFTATPTATVTLQADPMDLIAECAEDPDGACGIPTGLEVVDLPGCAGQCDIVAQATATPMRSCEGESIVVSGAGSSSSLCPGGVLEYQLRDGSGVVFPWQASPDFNVTPTMTTNFRVDVRCADPSVSDTCTDTRSVEARVDLPPVFSANVNAVDVANCNRGIELTWEPAVFRNASGTGTYTVYRSEISAADALTRPPLVTCLAATTYFDSSTSAEQEYFYVVAAEGSATMSACDPRGPCNGGSVTRVEANAGAGVIDSALARPDLLPKIECSVRLGASCTNGFYGPTFTDICWETDVPLSGDEHFHVLRSESPGSAFSRINSDSPLLRAGGLFDTDADHPTRPHVFYYLVFTADACENENRGAGVARCER